MEIKKNLTVFILSILLFQLTACEHTSVSAKNVVIELGDSLPQSVSDYLFFEEKNAEKIQKNAKLDLSNIDYMTVGEYEAIVVYKNQQIIVPVSIVDTTPPEILLKDNQFQEGAEVKVNDLVEVVDFSDTELSLIPNSDWLNTNVVILRPNMRLKVRAIDIYGNESIKEFIPNVFSESEKVGVPPKRIYSNWMDFSYESMNYIDDDIYEDIKSAYNNIEWYSEYEKGNADQFELLRVKFKELLLLERTFTNPESGEKLTLKNFPPIKTPDGIQATYDMESYQYYFFDMDGDGAQELCIPEISFLSIFKYNIEHDEIVLWKKLDAAFYFLGGSRTVFWSDGSVNAFYKLDQDGKEECTIRFYMRSYKDGEAYCVALPKYTVDGEQIRITKEMEQQCYYDSSGKYYYFRVTEDQYNELTENFYQALALSQEELEKVTFTYQELIE